MNTFAPPSFSNSVEAHVTSYSSVLCCHLLPRMPSLGDRGTRERQVRALHGDRSRTLLGPTFRLPSTQSPSVNPAYPFSPVTPALAICCTLWFLCLYAPRKARSLPVPPLPWSILGSVSVSRCPSTWLPSQCQAHPCLSFSRRYPVICALAHVLISSHAEPVCGSFP